MAVVLLAPVRVIAQALFQVVDAALSIEQSSYKKRNSTEIQSTRSSSGKAPPTPTDAESGQAGARRG
jgi:hypothetical protein